MRRVYAQIPDVQCKGLCHAACGPILMSRAESTRMRARGVEPPGLLDASALRCSKLGADNRCTIYADRPLICRLYGTTRELRCPYGCTPAGGWLPDRRARKLISELDRLPPTTQPEE